MEKSMKKFILKNGSENYEKNEKKIKIGGKMKKNLTLGIMMILIIIIAQSAFADVSVDGFCYLEGETNHSGTKVLFNAVSPTAVTDSVYTISDGSFNISLAGGIYTVNYSHDGWQPYFTGEIALFANTTLDEVTLAFGVIQEVSGPQSGTWSSDYIYNVIGDINVPAGDSLIIEPGVTVKFMGYYSLYIHGYLFAVGTETDSIYFTSGQNTPNLQDWNQLRFENDSDSNSIISYAKMEYSDDGIGCQYSSPTISNNTITKNYYYGIYCYDSSPTISNNTIINNNYRGINCDNSSPAISNNIISNNSRGIYCWGSSPTISNNVITNNSSKGIYCDGSSPIICKNTIGNNAIGIYCDDDSSPTILNNILFENYTGIDADASPSSCEYNLFWENNNDFTGDGIPSYFGEIVTVNANGDPCDSYMNLFMDPLFVDPANFNYHLLGNSPCIDAGNPDPIYYDPDGTIADMGAFYFSQNIPFANFSADVTAGDAPLEVNFTDLSLPVSAPIIEWYWDFGDGNTSSLQNPTNIYQNIGLYTVTLTVTDADDLTDTETKTDYINVHITLINIPGDYLTIQEGINASVNGDMVLVQPGTYIEDINFNGKNITVASLFLTTQDTSYVSQTIINGTDNDAVTFDNDEDSTSVLCGFTITSTGIFVDGINCDATSPTISNNTISHNDIGISCYYSSSPTISNNTISHNDHGTGIYCSSSNPTISNNIISDNYHGTGISCYYSSSPTISNNTISHNAHGTGIYCSSSNPTISNNTISYNDYGQGIYCYSSSSPTISNNTISYHVGFSSVGIICSSSSPTILNNILFENSKGIDADASPSSCEYNLFWENDNDFTGDGIPSYFGEIVTVNANGDPCDIYYNLFMDPLFVDPVNFDFHLTENSPCIDAGNPDPIYYDPDGTVADIGAFYFDQSQLPLDADFSATPTSGNAPLTVNFTDLSTGNPISWEWDFQNDGTIDSYDQNPVWIYNEPGIYTVSLSVSDGTNTDTEIKTDYISVTSETSHALQFDGTDDYVNCGHDASLNLTTTMTIEAWINPTDWGEADNYGFGRIFDKGTFRLFLNGEGSSYHDHSLAFGMVSGSSFTLNTPENSINLVGWQHIAATYDGNGGAHIYINGIEQTLTGDAPSGSIDDNSADDLFIGENFNQNRAFEGSIDEFRMWNIVRTQTEIQANMQNYLEGTEEGLIGYWRMNEGSGQTAFDLSENGNDGQLGSTPSTDDNDPTWIATDWPYGINLQADFSATPTSGDAPLTVNFTDQSIQGTGAIVEWKWYFGDGDSSSVQNPTHIYDNPGTYTVSLTVTDEYDSTDTETKVDYINVYEHITLINIPDDYPTIQGGINAAIDADTVLVQPGAYVENINFNGKNITVASLFLTTLDTTYISQTIINGNHSGRVVTINSGEELTALLTGFTITNGYTSGDWPNDSGAGLFIDNSSPTISYCIISGNSADGCGAGITWLGLSSPTISNCTISWNSAPNSVAGGILCQSSEMANPPLIENCTIESNSAKSGAGVYLRDNTTLKRCLVINNTAVAVSGSGGNGGGFYCYENSPTIENCTISGNSADNSSGAIRLNSVTLTMINTIVEGNFGNEGINFLDASSSSFTYCDFYNNQGGDFGGEPPAGLGIITGVNTNGDPCDEFFNIFLDPLFASTRNDSSYYLTESSPCIDAGDPSYPLDPDGTIADMGAFYFDQPSPPSVPTNVIIYIQSDSVHITWDPVPGCTYNLYSSTDPYAQKPWLDVETGISDTSWSAPLTDEKKFYYVTAVESPPTKNSSKSRQSK